MAIAQLKLACLDIHVRGDDHAAAMARAMARHHHCHVTVLMVNLPWRVALMLESGRPVMVVPRNASLDASLSHVAVAWRSTPEASRALHDALPLLAPGATIDLVTVCAR